MTLDSLIPFLWVVWSLWMIVAAFCVYNIWTYPRLMNKQDAASREAVGRLQKRAVVIVPIKGLTPLTRDFYHCLLHQDYEDYRLIFCFESNQDPAAILLRKELGLADNQSHHVPSKGSAAPGLQDITLVSAGHASNCGQKVHNQLAAMFSINNQDEIIAFADADMLCGNDWLQRLVAPLNLGLYQVVGAYRYFIPESLTLTNLLASVMNGSVATLGGRDVYNVLWGGSMAITHTVFEALDVPELFKGSLNDDLHLARAARRAGYRIGFVRSLILPSPIDFSLPDFIEFARRQYYQVRHYTPKLYTGAALATNLYSVGWITSLAAAVSGYSLAWIPWLTVELFSQLRAVGRARAVRQLFDEDTTRTIRPARFLEHFATPLWMILHGLIALSALFMGRVSWSGVTYKVSHRQKTDILARSEIIAD